MSSVDTSIELDITAVKKRSVKGMFSLVGRTIIIQAVGFVSNLGLTILLSPKDYGVFILVSAITGFLSYLSDIGLAAALIQKKEAVTQNDLKTTFTIQQLLVGTIVICGLIFSHWAGRIFNLQTDAVWLLRILVISLFFSSLKTIPSILLERRLSFEKFVIPQLAENIVFSVAVLFLAWKGFGVSSFTYSVILRSITGIVFIYIVSPWKPGLGIDKQSAKGLIKFGVPFQLNSILALFKDDFMTIILGKVLNVTQVGYLGWAQKWAYLPLRVIMDNVIRVTFPAFSRLQSDKNALKSAIEEAMFISALLTFPILTGLLMASQSLIRIIPDYEKWQPAYILLIIYILGSYISSVTVIITNALNAIGKIKITLKLMLFWTSLTWLFSIPLALRYSSLGAALAWLLVTISTTMTFIIAYKILKINSLSVLFSPTLASIVMIICIQLLFTIINPDNIFSLSLIIISGFVAYLLTCLLSAKRRLIKNLAMFKSSLK